jgi:hypothetical protein
VGTRRDATYFYTCAHILGRRPFAPSNQAIHLDTDDLSQPAKVKLIDYGSTLEEGAAQKLRRY